MSKDELLKALFEHRRVVAVSADQDCDPAVAWIDLNGDLICWAPEIGIMKNHMTVFRFVEHLVDTVQDEEGGHLFINGYVD